MYHDNTVCEIEYNSIHKCCSTITINKYWLHTNYLLNNSIFEQNIPEEVVFYDVEHALELAENENTMSTDSTNNISCGCIGQTNSTVVQQLPAQTK